MQHPIDVAQLSPQVAKVCGPAAPPPLKQMTAAGAAPLPPPDLLSALYVLAFDANADLSAKAKGTIDKMPDSILESALKKIPVEGVLDGLAQLLLLKYAPLIKILQNKACGDETVVWIAKKSTDEKLLEVIAANEQRMLKAPVIIEALYFNKFTRMSTADRAVELAVRNEVELTGIPAYAELKQVLADELIPEPTDEPAPDDILFKENLKITEELPISDDKVKEVLDAEEAGETVEDEEAEEVVETVRQQLANMNTSQKIRTATLGNSSQRSILIRDSNKLVIMAVMKSPLLTDSEVQGISNLRTLPVEALSYIANQREWTKHYQVKLNLVSNPRTPIKDALHFMNYLRDREIKNLSRDKNVPQAIARAAKQLKQKRGGN